MAPYHLITSLARIHSVPGRWPIWAATGPTSGPAPAIAGTNYPPALRARLSTEFRIDGDAQGTALPLPPWRLHSGPRSSPIDPIIREWYRPRPERDDLTSSAWSSSARIAAFFRARTQWSAV